MISRRNLLWLLLAGGLSLPQNFAYAEDFGGYSRDRGGNDHGEDHGSDEGGTDHGEDHGSNVGGTDQGEDPGSDDGGNDNGQDPGSDDGGNDNGKNDGDEDDQDRALNAVRNDHAASLKDVLTIVREQYEGEIVHVSLRGSGPTLIYYIKLLDSGDRLIEVQIDALSRQIVHVEGT